MLSSLLQVLLSVLFGLLTANGVEWAMHKFVLHGWGRKRGTFWAFHFHEHHRLVRQHAYFDPNYRRFALGAHAQGKEAWGLIAVSVAVTPLLPLAPAYVITLWYAAANYYRVHKRSHLDPQWARQRIPWHYDHHTGRNPNANWCVTRPWFDYLLGTREFTTGNPRESNVLGLPCMPSWLQRWLPSPARLARETTAAAPLA